MDVLKKDKFLFVKMIAALVSLTGGIVLLGWAFDIHAFKGILPHWKNMEFNTALSFLLSGLVLWLIANSHQSHSIQSSSIMPVATMGILIVMGTMLATSLAGPDTGIDDWLGVYAAKTGIPDTPSLGTISAFIVISLTGVLTMMAPPKAPHLRMAGVVEMGFGGTVLLGYQFDLPLLCFDIEEICTAMTLPSSILFFMLGLGLLILGSIRR